MQSLLTLKKKGYVYWISLQNEVFHRWTLQRMNRNVNRYPFILVILEKIYLKRKCGQQSFPLSPSITVSNTTVSSVRNKFWGVNQNYTKPLTLTELVQPCIGLLLCSPSRVISCCFSAYCPLSHIMHWYAFPPGSNSDSIASNIIADFEISFFWNDIFVCVFNPRLFIGWLACRWSQANEVLPDFTVLFW